MICVCVVSLLQQARNAEKAMWVLTLSTFCLMVKVCACLVRPVGLTWPTCPWRSAAFTGRFIDCPLIWGWNDQSLRAERFAEGLHELAAWAQVVEQVWSVSGAQLFSLSSRTALARFRQAQLEEGKVKVGSELCLPVCLPVWPSVCKLSVVCLQERRPFLASECSDLPKAEKWRRQVCILQSHLCLFLFTHALVELTWSVNTPSWWTDC